jgi:hypothetical protein
MSREYTWRARASAFNSQRGERREEGGGRRYLESISSSSLLTAHSSLVTCYLLLIGLKNGD